MFPFSPNPVAPKAALIAVAIATLAACVRGFAPDLVVGGDEEALPPTRS